MSTTLVPSSDLARNHRMLNRFGAPDHVSRHDVDASHQAVPRCTGRPETTSSSHSVQS